MKFASNVAFVLMAASLILAACGYADAITQSPSLTAVFSTGTRTASPSSSPIVSEGTVLYQTPSPTPTSTPRPCDLSVSDYCIETGFFVFQPPIAPPGTDTIDRSYPYGSTKGGTRDPHHGVEFYNASGTPVLAAAGGMVNYAGNDTTRKFSPWFGFYGNIIILEHSFTGTPFDRLYTVYAHLSKMDVSSGQTVTAGEKIGEVGLTGTASGSHLHFEVRVDPDDYDSTLNPELWLVPHPGNGALAIQFLDDHGNPVHPLEIQVQYKPDPARPFTANYYPEVYSFEPPVFGSPFQENAALGDLPAGNYRIAFVWAGLLYEKQFEIQPRKLTRVMFGVK